MLASRDTILQYTSLSPHILDLAIGRTESHEIRI